MSETLTGPDPRPTYTLDRPKSVGCFCFAGSPNDKARHECRLRFTTENYSVKKYLRREAFSREISITFARDGKRSIRIRPQDRSPAPAAALHGISGQHVSLRAQSPRRRTSGRTLAPIFRFERQPPSLTLGTAVQGHKPPVRIHGIGRSRSPYADSLGCSLGYPDRTPYLGHIQSPDHTRLSASAARNNLT